MISKALRVVSGKLRFGDPNSSLRKSIVCKVKPGLWKIINDKNQLTLKHCDYVNNLFASTNWRQIGRFQSSTGNLRVWDEDYATQRIEWSELLMGNSFAYVCKVNKNNSHRVYVCSNDFSDEAIEINVSNVTANEFLDIRKFWNIGVPFNIKYNVPNSV